MQDKVCSIFFLFVGIQLSFSVIMWIVKSGCSNCRLRCV